MLKKIDNLVRQLSEKEQQILLEHIEGQYSVEFKGKGMLRDDIKDKVIELMYSLYEWVAVAEIKEDYSLEGLCIDTEVELLSTAIENEFNIEYINPDNIQRWETVKDVVSYIENNFESEA